ncbi:S41 family peptidase [Chitinimonas sp.]|uniref:S41 family peptidase n=1 Tax=Chitinimonas sp. TaxID=1934313 RepID=UPI0035AFFECF
MKRFRLALLAAALSASSFATSNGYFRFPSIYRDTVSFTAEGDVWTASLNGGEARRLTSNPASEIRSSISPDGRWIAFTAAYEGPQEVYVMPLQGGEPTRLTFHNSRALTLGWTASGEVLYSTAGATGPLSERIVAAVHPQTLQRRVFPLSDANDAVLDERGEYLYFVRFGLAVTNDNARQYRGGALSQLWRYKLGGNGEAERIGPRDANLRRPMWWQGRLLVISDQDGHDNLWSLQPDGSGAQQLTRHTDFDVRSASLGQGRVVYQLGADLRLFDLASRQDQVLNIKLLSDYQQTRERWLRQPLQYGTATALAGNGERLALTVRGHVLVAGENKLRRAEVAQPAGSRLRNAVLSPDGKWVYAVCDASGEQEIWQFPADGSGSGKALTQDGDGLRLNIQPSPDGKWLAHTDKKGRLWLLELASGKNTVIDDASKREGGNLQRHEYDQLSWSADSRNLLFVRPNSNQGRNQLALYSLDRNLTQWLTSDKYDSHSPVFSADGRWLWFLSERQFQLANQAPWGDRNTGPQFSRRSKVYGLALQPDAQFAFAAKTELSSAAADSEAKPADSKEGKKDDAKKPGGKPAIVLDGLPGRLYEVPLAAGDYRDLGSDGSRLYVLDNEGDTLKTFAIDNKGAAAETFMGEVQEFALSHNGKKLFIRKKAARGLGDMYIVDAAAKAPADIAKQAIALNDWALRIDPREEWRQMFNDAWRMHRDYFFDPAMRGVDWSAARRKYAPLVERVNERAELDDVLAQMSAELGALHSQIVPGEERPASDVATPAGLGAELEPAANGWRIARIYKTERELPAERSPLQAPGLDIRDGDVIIAVNGRPSRDLRDFSDALRNQAGQQLLLELQRGDGKPWKAVVTPVNAQQQMALRYGDWEQGNKAQVEKLGGGKLGYLHLRAMGAADISSFVREFYAQVDREGLIIDVRRNNGGNIDSWVIEKLLRRVWAFWQGSRSFANVNMQQSFRGRLVVLTDALTYSDGETFAAGVKALKLGPIVGSRTAGAGVWLNDANRLADLGMARAANAPQFDVAGNWLVEGVGVAPDIEVENPPHASFLGEDRQLQTAIATLQRLLKETPVPKLEAKPIPSLGR